jgi:hypothetical protein
LGSPRRNCVGDFSVSSAAGPAGFGARRPPRRALVPGGQLPVPGSGLHVARICPRSLFSGPVLDCVPRAFPAIGSEMAAQRGIARVEFKGRRVRTCDSLEAKAGRGVCCATYDQVAHITSFGSNVRWPFPGPLGGAVICRAGRSAEIGRRAFRLRRAESGTGLRGAE